MTNLNSVSDLARSYQLRLSQSFLKSKLNTLTQEMTTGVKADIPLALGGDLGRINHVEARLTQLKAHRNSIAEAQSLFSGMQNALGSIQSLATATGTMLLSEALISSEAALQIHVKKSPEELSAVLAALNTSVAGRFAFSGSRTDQPAVVDYGTLMTQISNAVGGATTAIGIIAGIDAYFDAPAGSGGFADNGYIGDDTGTTSIAVSPNRKLDANFTANSPDMRQILKGFALMSYAAENPALDSQTVRSLSRAAGTHIVAGEAHIINARSTIGIQEESSARIKTANEAEASTLTIARNSLIAADPAETAAALKEIEANIETVYTLTARLSKLSLTDYL